MGESDLVQLVLILSHTTLLENALHFIGHLLKVENRLESSWKTSVGRQEEVGAGSRGEIPQQLLEPYQKQPSPQVPKICPYHQFCKMARQTQRKKVMDI